MSKSLKPPILNRRMTTRHPQTRGQANSSARKHHNKAWRKKHCRLAAAGRGITPEQFRGAQYRAALEAQELARLQVQLDTELELQRRKELERGYYSYRRR